MTPKTKDLTNNIKITTEPSRTYKLHFDSDYRVVGEINGIDAIKQAVFKVLQTERYQHIIYSWRYGVEFGDLFGKLIPFVYAELERRIKEALLQDDRIMDVDNFEFTNKKTEDKTEVLATFRVVSKLGNFEEEVAVRVL